MSTPSRRLPVLTTLDEKQISELRSSKQFFWLNLQDPTDEQMDRLGALLDLHPLSVEDTKRFGQRPKIDSFDNYMLLVFYGAQIPKDGGDDAARGEEMLQEVHAFICGDGIVTVHRGDFQPLRTLQASIGNRSMRSEQFVVYEIVDAVVDSFFPVLESMDGDIDDLEDHIIAEASESDLQTIFSMKRRLVSLRRIVTPQRDLFARNIEAISSVAGLEEESHDYFRDVYDHLLRISDMVDTYRDLLSGCTDLYLSTVANRQGEISKQLTIIASIFLPLSFLTGFFGMNFAFLTGHIQMSLGSFLGLGLGSMVLSAITMFLYFRHRGWTRRS